MQMCFIFLCLILTAGLCGHINSPSLVLYIFLALIFGLIYQNFNELVFESLAVVQQLMPTKGAPPNFGIPCDL